MSRHYENPCHSNGVDCPDRHAGCAATCEKWAEYVRKRNRNYNERLYYSDIECATDRYFIQRLRAPKKRHSSKNTIEDN